MTLKKSYSFHACSPGAEGYGRPEPLPLLSLSLFFDSTVKPNPIPAPNPLSKAADLFSNHVPFGLSFLASMIQEIAKGIEDMEGDRQRRFRGAVP